MNINELLKGFRILVQKKLDEELESQIDMLIKDDASTKVIKNVKEVMIDNLKSVNERVKAMNDNEDLYSDDELEEIISFNVNKIKLTKQTLKQIDLVKESTIRRKNKLNNQLNEVSLLATYLKNPEDITKLLINYNILTKEEKFNMDIV